MKAAVRDRFGSPEVVEIRELDRPVAADDEVLVRVRAASVNPFDWFAVIGRPYLGRLIGVGLRTPKSNRLGVDFAGTVEALGRDVTQFRPGDEVFGGANGAYAEYVCVREERGVASKPANLIFEEAAAVPVAAITALQALRDKGRVRPGQKVLINGASGGVGTFAVQIAKAFGAEVTGVCSTRNMGLVRSIGADHVVDYTREDFTTDGRRYDLMIDNAGSRSFSECRRVLAPEGTLVTVGGRKGNRTLFRMLAAPLAAVGKSQKVVSLFARITKDDMVFLHDLLEAGKVRPVIDRRYQLSEIADALRYMGEGHARGKVVVTV